MTNADNMTWKMRKNQVAKQTTSVLSNASIFIVLSEFSCLFLFDGYNSYESICKVVVILKSKQ